MRIPTTGRSSRSENCNEGSLLSELGLDFRQEQQDPKGPCCARVVWLATKLSLFGVDSYKAGSKSLNKPDMSDGELRADITILNSAKNPGRYELGCAMADVTGAGHAGCRVLSFPPGNGDYLESTLSAYYRGCPDTEGTSS